MSFELKSNFFFHEISKWHTGRLSCDKNSEAIQETMSGTGRFKAEWGEEQKMGEALGHVKV